MNMLTSYTELILETLTLVYLAGKKKKKNNKTENPTKTAYSFSGKNSFFICHVHIISFESP